MNFNGNSFTLINNKAQDRVIYSTTDTSWNVLTLTILNNTGADLKLIGGAPVSAPNKGPASSFAFDFSSILTGAQAGDVKVSDKDGLWGQAFFPALPHGNPTLAVAPKSDLLFPSGKTIELTIENIACTTQTPGNFDVFYYNMPGISDPVFALSYHISVLNLPIGKNLGDYVDFGLLLNSVAHLIGNQPKGVASPRTALALATANPQTPIPVDITYDNNYPIRNGFTFYLKNKTPQPLEPAGTPLGKATLYVSMIFATQDPDAITSQSWGDIIKISFDAEKSSWKSQQHQQETPYWIFTPTSSEVLFANETILFPIDTLITELNTAPDTLSTLYIQYNFIPGFADGVFTLQMQKQLARASITSASVTPSTIDYGKNVSFAFTAEVAWKATLAYVLRDGTQVTLKSPDNFPSYGGTFAPTPPPDKEQTDFTLSVYDARTGAADQYQATVTVTQPIPAIASFTADSMLVNINGSAATTLRWVINNPTGVKSILIDNGVGQQDPSKGSGSVNVAINQTITYTITVTPWGVKDPVVQMSVTVFAYKSYAPVPIGPMGNGTAFQSLPLSLTNRTARSIYVANAASGSCYVVNCVNQTVSPGLSGNVMALSTDERKLFAAVNGGPAPGVVLMGDTSNLASPFSVPEPGPPPYSLAITPGCTQLYYLWRHGLTTVSVFSVNEGANSFTYVKDIPVGKSPEPCAFDSRGATLYVGNYDSQSVSVIDVNSNTVTKTIQLTTTEPNAFALAGTMLFVACSGSNLVEVIDTSSNTNIAQIAAGFQPFSLTLDQNKARLFVTNFQGGSVTIIDTASRKVIGTLAVGKGPSAAKITESGNLMFVSNYCDKSLTVVDISNGGAKVIGSILMEPTNGNPIDVSTFGVDNHYTDVFVAKEYFNGRNNGCASSSPTDANLNMSIFSIQEQTAGKTAARAAEAPRDTARTALAAPNPAESISAVSSAPLTFTSQTQRTGS